MTLQSSDAIVCSAFLDATITVGNKSPLQHLVGVVEIEMVHDAVAELRGDYLSHLWVGDDEASGRTGAVSAVPQFVAQLLEILLSVHFKTLLVWFLPLVSPSIDISLVKVEEQLVVGKAVGHNISRISPKNEDVCANNCKKMRAYIKYARYNS